MPKTPTPKLKVSKLWIECAEQIVKELFTANSHLDQQFINMLLVTDDPFVRGYARMGTEPYVVGKTEKLWGQLKGLFQTNSLTEHGVACLVAQLASSRLVARDHLALPGDE